MSILGHILTAPVAGPIRGVLWLARAIDDQVKGEIHDEDKIRAALTELEIKLDLGEIELNDYELQEEVLLRRLKEIREMKKNGEIWHSTKITTRRRAEGTGERGNRNPAGRSPQGRIAECTGKAAAAGRPDRGGQTAIDGTDRLSGR